MKKLRQKLNNELDRVIPELSEQVKNAPIIVAEGELNNENKRN